MALKLITAAATLPVTLASVKLHCGVEDASFDALLTELLADAVDHVQELLGRALGEQTWQLTLTEFADVIELPRGPVLELVEDSFKYWPPDGSQAIVAPGLYTLDAIGNPAAIVRNDGESWPRVDVRPNAIELQFTTGWTEATLPRGLRRAVCVLVAAWFEDRTAGAPKAVMELVHPYRRIRI